MNTPAPTLPQTATFHSAASRGHADHGWLDTYHTFSFAGYHDPERMNFGVLRVLNDDTVAGGRGFGAHPHDNMEIVSIPLEGDLVHEDSMGNRTTIEAGDVQVMSAGTGVRHSEKNAHLDRPVKFLQIWMFPKARDVEPRYGQITVAPTPGQWTQVLSPNPDDAGVWVHQDAWWSIGAFGAGQSVAYRLHAPDTNGVYLFVLEGEGRVGDRPMGRRDGLGLTGVDTVTWAAESESRVLLMEVPMALG